MLNAAETQQNSAVGASAAQTAKSETVDPDIFARELESKIVTSARERTQSVLEKLAAAFPGTTVSTKYTASFAEVREYSIQTGPGTYVNIGSDMMSQMGEDDDMFARVKDLLSSLFSAGNSQNMVNAGGSDVSRSVNVNSTEVRYVETQRGSNGTQLSVSSFALQTQEVVSNALDQLLGVRNQNSGKSSNQSIFETLMGGSSSWRFESFISSQSLQRATGSWSSTSGSSSGLNQMMRSRQSFVASIEVLVQQWSASGQGGSGTDLMSFMNMMGLYDPLVLDLGDEGFNLTSAEDGVYFDIKGDGSPTRTAFISGNNAFLYLDGNGNGVADDANELFGDHGGFSNGWEKLAQYDDNGDGIIDERDAIYSQLRLWRDLNGDGVNQADESMSLAEAGIKSINLRHDNSRQTDANGNVIADRSTFTRSDGTQGQIADVWLKTR